MDPAGPIGEEEGALPIGCAAPFLAILGAFALVLTADYLTLVARAVRAARWPEVPARVEAAALDDLSDGDGVSRRLRVSFRYPVAGREHRGEWATARQRAWILSSDLLPGASAAHLRAARAALRGGAPIPCRVDPDDPSRAYLFAMGPRDWLEPTCLWAIFGLLPLAAGGPWLRRGLAGLAGRVAATARRARTGAGPASPPRPTPRSPARRW